MSTDNLTGTLSSTGNLNGTFGTSGGGGTSNYNDLANKPQINGNTLEGNKTPAQLGINIPDMTNYYNKSETNTLLDGKANVSDLPDMNNYYDKSETDNLLDGKADTSDLPDMNNYYNKSETDTLLDSKVNNSSFNAASLPIQSGSATNTKDYIDTKLSGKADSSDTYTKTEVDNIVAGRKCITYSLVTTSTLTGTDTTFNTFSGRKFSDYDLYIFTFGESATYMRRTAIVTKSQWVSGASVSEGVLHGSGSSSASDYSYCGMVISYNSDTSVKGRVIGSESINKFSIIGIKY